MGAKNDKKWCPTCELEWECQYYKDGCTLDNPLEECVSYALWVKTKTKREEL